MHRLSAALAIATLAAIVAAGCGSSASEDASGSGEAAFEVRADTTMATADSLTKQKFLTHVNSLCERKWLPILKAVKQTARVRLKSPRATQRQRFIVGVKLSYFASLDFHLFDEIHRLGAPPGERRTVERLIGAMQEGVERGERQVTATSPSQIEAVFTRYNRLARNYGLHDCLVAGAHLPHPDEI